MTRTIDIHAHMLPEETLRLLAKESPRVAPRLITHDDGSLDLEIDGRLVQRPLPPEIWDHERRLADMDRNGVDMQLVCTTVFTFFYDAEPSLGAACAMLQNEQIAAVVKRHPERFLGLATLPMQDPAKAADELRRSMQKLGLRGAQIGSHVNGKNLDDPSFDAVWEVANELRAFFLIHPHGDPTPGGRLNAYYMRNFVGLPFETTIAGVSLLFGGVLERYPNIAFCLSHGGGFVPYQAGRFLHGYGVRPEPKSRLRGMPEESLGRLYYDSIVHSSHTLEYLIESVGPEHVLLGSDYPFDMGNLDCVARVRAISAPKQTQDVVLGERARTLLGLD